MKRLFAFLLIALLMAVNRPESFAAELFSADRKESISSSLSAEAVSENDASMQVDIDCKAALLMEASTGKVLTSIHEHEKRYPASVTKIMSLLLICEAIEAGKLSLADEIPATPEACSKGGSQIWLEPGETMTVDELLKATCIFSANDACTLLGEAVAGSDEAFVAMMNEKAAMLGMNDTNFENCTGLDDTAENHLTSAYDIALMSRALLKHDIVKEYSTVYMDTLRQGKTQLVNTNKLVRTYKGITGLKTGTTDKAGCCISATAERDGLSLIAVVLGARDSAERFSGAKKLLDWGFANYECFTPRVENEELPVINVYRGAERTVIPVPKAVSPVVLKRGQSKAIKAVAECGESVLAPVEKGQTLGMIKYYLDEEIIAQIRLIAPDDIPKITVFDYLKKMLLQG